MRDGADSTNSTGSAASREAPPAGATSSAGSLGPGSRRAVGAAATLDGLREMLRTRGGWLVGLCGVLLCALGWYGVSGERYEARQVPYLASATIPGAALIVAGAVLVVGTRRGGVARVSDSSGLPNLGGPAGSSGSPDAELRLVLGQLYRLLVEPAPEADTSLAPPPAAADAPWVAVPGGARYHRRECSLVRGKNGVRPVDETTALNRDLRPCRLCDPDDRGDPGDPGDPRASSASSASGASSASAGSGTSADSGPTGASVHGASPRSEG